MRRSKRNVLGLPVAAAAVLTLAVACSGGSSNTAGDGPATGSPAATSTDAPPAAEIDQVNLEFVPDQVTVRVGDVVLFRNSETAIHNAVVNGTDVTGNMMKDSAIPWKAPAPGEYTVTCDYHPLMKATITVTK